MEDSIKIDLSLLDLNQYESKVLKILIQFGHLDAKYLSTNSKVPQSKIYETADSLSKKGYIDIIIAKNKKIFQIKPKQILEERIQKHYLKIKEQKNNILNFIDKSYRESTYDVMHPFYGIAERENISDQIITIAQSVESEIIGYFPVEYFTDHIYISFNRLIDKGISISLIFDSYDILRGIQKKIPKAHYYFKKDLNINFFLDLFNIETNLTDNTYNVLKNQGIPTKLVSKNKINEIIREMSAQFIKNIFIHAGLFVYDRKISLSLIPIPFKIPIAIVSGYKDVLDVYIKTIIKLIEGAQKINDF